MADTAITLGAALITGADEAVCRFVDCWNDGRDTIEAQTSGSTGTPKTIALPKADMLVSARATCRHFGIGADSRLVLPLSASYIAGKMMVVRAIVSGARLDVVQPSRRLDQVGDLDGPIDLLPIVPAQAEALCRLPNLAMIRNVIVGGGALNAEQESMLAELPINAYATYGMTETCSHVALRRIGRDDSFTAMPGVTFATDSRGCLVVNAPEYSFGSLVTNDMVHLADDRRFRWLGRADNVINSGGIKLHPEEIEQMLRPYLPDAEYYVSSRSSQAWGREPVLVVAGTAAGAEVAERALRHAAQHLPHTHLPKAVVMVPALAYTPTGKVIRTPVETYQEKGK